MRGFRLPVLDYRSIGGIFLPNRFWVCMNWMLHLVKRSGGMCIRWIFIRFRVVGGRIIMRRIGIDRYGMSNGIATFSLDSFLFQCDGLYLIMVSWVIAVTLMSFVMRVLLIWLIETLSVQWRLPNVRKSYHGPITLSCSFIPHDARPFRAHTYILSHIKCIFI